VRGRRDSVFVIDKIDHLHEPVAPQIERSLARLRLSRRPVRVPLVLEVDRPRPPARAGGGFEQLANEKRSGRVPSAASAATTRTCS
jgi:hypothetical protein